MLPDKHQTFSDLSLNIELPQATVEHSSGLDTRMSRRELEGQDTKYPEQS